MARKREIINPNKISMEENDFINQKDLSFTSNINSKTTELPKSEYKNVMVTMPVSFLKDLDNYIKLNPAEGRRSNVIVRVVADYLKNKTTTI
jgi:hypothetical protein